MLAGDPRWMISRSVAQIATASIRTSTSARLGIGVRLSRNDNSSGPPSTQAFICSGTGNSAEVVTPVGLYMAAFPCAFFKRLRQRLMAPAADAIGLYMLAGRSCRLLTGLWRRNLVDLQRVDIGAACRFRQPEQLRGE